VSSFRFCSDDVVVVVVDVADGVEGVVVVVAVGVIGLIGKVVEKDVCCWVDKDDNDTEDEDDESVDRLAATIIGRVAEPEPEGIGDGDDSVIACGTPPTRVYGNGIPIVLLANVPFITLLLFNSR
jgi:hypothetical protein